MGGNVFKDYLATKDPEYVGRRLETIDYHSALFAVECILKELGLNYSIIDYVREKSSHGDLDIIVEHTRPVSNVLADLLSKKVIAVKTSSSSLSFLLLTFQVDLIFIESDKLDYAKKYFSWNDLGNLVGRVAKNIGFKHCHDCLKFVQREGDRVYKEHILSTDYNSILRILELDVDHFNKGFDTYIEMFEWVSKSPYFIPEKFEFDNLNNRNRVRDKKRKVYNMFLEWCKNQKFEAPIIIEDKDKFVLSVFPEFQLEYDSVLTKIQTDSDLKLKFNGTLLKEWTNLEGKDLGSFISKFKTKYSTQDLLNSSAENIEQLVKDFYKIYDKVV